MGLETRATLELGLEFALNEFVGSEVSAVWGKSRVGVLNSVRLDPWVWK